MQTQIKAKIVKPVIATQKKTRLKTIDSYRLIRSDFVAELSLKQDGATEALDYSLKVLAELGFEVFITTDKLIELQKKTVKKTNISDKK